MKRLLFSQYKHITKVDNKLVVLAESHHSEDWLSLMIVCINVYSWQGHLLACECERIVVEMVNILLSYAAMPGNSLNISLALSHDVLLMLHEVGI